MADGKSRATHTDHDEVARSVDGGNKEHAGGAVQKHAATQQQRRRVDATKAVLPAHGVPLTSGHQAARSKGARVFTMRKCCEYCRYRHKRCDGDGVNMCRYVVRVGG